MQLLHGGDLNMKKDTLAVLIGLVFLFAFTLVLEGNANAMVVIPTPIKVTVNKKVFRAYLEHNETTDKFIEMLPTTVEMLNTNNREMRYDFSATLPSKQARRNAYHVGEIVYLAASRSLVIFYQQAGGEIDNLQRMGGFSSEEDVAFFQGLERASVTFELDTD